GLPALVSVVPETALNGVEVKDGTAPLPTLSSVLAGTLVTWPTTLAGSAVRPELDELGVDEPWLSLTATNTATTTRTSRVLPPVISSRLRRSSRCAAARCAAIFSRALCCLILLALPIACPQEGSISPGRTPS